MNTITISNIDWKLLKEQKAWLLQHDGEHYECSEHAEGLICLLDALEDAAEASHLID